MPSYFTANDVVEKSFVFISYSHADKVLTDELADFLLDSGVRLWYDKALVPGDKWKNEVEQLLCHPKCCGVILMCSPESIVSKNVAKERHIALEEQQKRGEDAYFVLPVNVCPDNKSQSFMMLLKKVFEKQSEDMIDELFPLERLFDFMKIVGPDPLSVMSNGTGYAKNIFDAIKARIPDAVDENSSFMEQMEKMSRVDGITFKMGKYVAEGVMSTLSWQFLYYKDNVGVFLLKNILDERLGEGIDDWLNTDFKNTAFTKEEQEKLIGDIRLLSLSETDGASPRLMKSDKQWWLSDVDGKLQMIVRENGTVNTKGGINYKIKRCVRPVIMVDMERATEIMKQQGK